MKLVRKRIMNAYAMYIFAFIHNDKWPIIERGLMKYKSKKSNASSFNNWSAAKERRGTIIYFVSWVVYAARITSSKFHTFRLQVLIVQLISWLSGTSTWTTLLLSLESGDPEVVWHACFDLHEVGMTKQFVNLPDFASIGCTSGLSFDKL